VKKLLGLLLVGLLIATSQGYDSATIHNAAHPLCGIGAVVRDEDGTPIVGDILPKTPAEKAGLHVNDQIIQVDAIKTPGMKLIDVVHLIRGPQGTDVQIVINRPSDHSQITFTVTRAPIALSAKYSHPRVMTVTTPVITTPAQ